LRTLKITSKHLKATNRTKKCLIGIPSLGGEKKKKKKKKTTDPGAKISTKTW